MKKWKILKASWFILIQAVMLVSFLSNGIGQMVPTMVNPTFKTETKFTVCPDGWVSAGILYNQTWESSSYSSPTPTGYATLKFGWDGLPKMSVNSEYTFPKESVKDFPYNATTLSLKAKKSADTITSEMNATVIMPPTARSLFPFNMTDLTLTSDFYAENVQGNITISFVDFPLSTIAFHGNETQVSLEGTAVVPFLAYQGMTIERADVIEAINQIESEFVGKGSNSLWNATEGLVECKSFTDTTTFSDDYASVLFDMQAEGNVTAGLSKMLLKTSWSLIGYPYRYYPVYPSETQEALESLVFKALDLALGKVQRDVIRVTYTHSDWKLEYKETTTCTTSNIAEDLLNILKATPNLPSSQRAFFDEVLGKIYASVKSGDFSATYMLVGSTQKEAKTTLTMDLSFEGDLNTQWNHLKSLFMLYYSYASPGSPTPWQLTFLNQTSVDLSRFRASFNTTATSIQFSCENLRLLPPKDVVNATHFKLKRFFNLTRPMYGSPTYESPVKITVQAGNNVTHKVFLRLPSNVPTPDSATNSSRMIWENERLSDIQDLTFQIVQVISGPVAGQTVTNPTAVTTANPVTINASQEAKAILTITGISAPTTIVVVKKTDAPDAKKTAPSAFSLLGSYVEVMCSEEVDVNATIRIDYTDEQLAAAGVDESTMRIHYWDADLGEWVEVETHVNTSENYAWATVNHFSIWGLFGQAATPFWTQWWFYLIIVAAIAAVAAGAYMFTRKRKPTTPTAPSISTEAAKPPS